MHRIFIALELPPRVRQRLGATIERLRRVAPRVRWVRPENLHLTLKFLGNVPPAELPAVFTAASAAAEACAAFTLEFAGLGCFPSCEHPRVIWAGTRPNPSCRELAAAVEREFDRLGYKPEPRRFTAHITLGRVRHPAQARDLETLLAQHQNRGFGTAEIDELTVFASELKPTGAVYTPMQHAPLGG